MKYTTQKTLLFLLLLISAFSSVSSHADETDEKTVALTDNPVWYSTDDNNNPQIHFYFFWSKTCPHCRRAHPYINELANEYSWITLHALELTTNRENINIYVSMAQAVGKVANSVPAFLFCEQMMVGYGTEETTGAMLKKRLQACYQRRLEQPTSITETSVESAENQSAPVQPAPASEDDNETEETTNNPQPVAKLDHTEEQPLHLPGFGTIDTKQSSLPLLTVLIAGFDAFNPCAFFVLLFLLSLLVHTRSRSRMLLIGGIFIFFSGFIYFLFMVAWLNVFLYLNELQWITLIAGLIAVIVALINIKDFFWFQQGVSLSIPSQAKPDLYQRMRNLVGSTALFPLIISTITLAIIANAYELLCTSGFPMVYTRILTLRELPTSLYYLYLIFYNLIYVIPLLIIVLVFTYTLGTRKLSETEGRGLKLISGLMMLGLGGILLVNPALLTNLIAAGSVIGIAIGLAIIIIGLEKFWRPNYEL
jgi:thiol-disulfide isomerase/thioredoxin